MNNFYLMFLIETVDKNPTLSPLFWVGAVFLVIFISVPWVVLIFLWCFKRYRVRFFGFHGEVLSVKYYKANSMFELPTNTDYPGYVFDGWYEDPEFNYPMSVNYVNDRNLKFYGKWIKVSDEI